MCFLDRLGRVQFCLTIPTHSSKETNGQSSGIRQVNTFSGLAICKLEYLSISRWLPSVAGLDNFKAKKEKKKERKRRAKLRKAEQREREKSSSGVVLTAASRAKSAPVLPEVIEYKDPKKRKRKQQPEVIFAITYHEFAILH